MKINFVVMYALKENNIAPRRLRKFAEALVKRASAPLHCL